MKRKLNKLNSCSLFSVKLSNNALYASNDHLILSYFMICQSSFEKIVYIKIRNKFYTVATYLRILQAYLYHQFSSTFNTDA